MSLLVCVFCFVVNSQERPYSSLSLVSLWPLSSHLGSTLAPPLYSHIPLFRLSDLSLLTVRVSPQYFWWIDWQSLCQLTIQSWYHLWALLYLTAHSSVVPFLYVVSLLELSMNRLTDGVCNGRQSISECSVLVAFFPASRTCIVKAYAFFIVFTVNDNSCVSKCVIASETDNLIITVASSIGS